MAGATALAVFFGARPGGSSPGGATESAASDFPVAALALSAVLCEFVCEFPLGSHLR
jgi:hypothetical protein